MERYLTPSEVAEIFGMSRSGVIKWIREGKGRLLRLTVGGEYLTAKLKDYYLTVEGLNK